MPLSPPMPFEPPVQYAFVKANWHSEIVDQALTGFMDIIPESQIEIFDVPGAFELPLVARDLARTGKYAAVIAAALVVDGGIYKHEFVAQAVVNGLMQAGMDSDIPVLSVSLTPHQFQDTGHHINIYKDHFNLKGREAARAALTIANVRSKLAGGIYGSKFSGDKLHSA